MKIDNQHNTYRIWLGRMIMTIVFTLIIVVIIFLPWFDNSRLWLNKYYIIIGISVIYIVINLYNSLKRPCYVSYSDHGEMLVVRYYHLSLFTAKKHSIEIPKQQLVRFELKKFLFGSQQKLILYQHFRNKIAKYPPISLSALPKQKQEKLLHSLNSYVKKT